MRVCILTANPAVAGTDRNSLRQTLGDRGEVELVYFSGYWPDPRLESNSYYLFSGLDTIRALLCRRILRFLQHASSPPRWLQVLPLRLCREEVIETLRAFDADVLMAVDLPWGSELLALFQSHCPQWRLHGDSILVRSTRRCDPSARVSIVLPTYNGSKYLPLSIQSCLSQTFPNLELIVVDDGSSEDIPAVVSSFDDRRIRYFRHDRNLQIAEALNTGFRHSTGQLLTWTSDDNMYAATALEEMVWMLQSYPDVGLVYADRYIFGDTPTKPQPAVRRSSPPRRLAQENVVGPCFLYRREVYEAIGNYNCDVFLAEDYDYWIRVAQRFRLQRLLKPVYFYRFHKESLTARYSIDQRLAITRAVQHSHSI